MFWSHKHSFILCLPSSMLLDISSVPSTTFQPLQLFEESREPWIWQSESFECSQEVSCHALLLKQALCQCQQPPELMAAGLQARKRRIARCKWPRNGGDGDPQPAQPIITVPSLAAAWPTQKMLCEPVSLRFPVLGWGSGCSLVGQPHVCVQSIACPKCNTSGQGNGFPLLHGNTETELLNCPIDFL